ncbi:MAG TPA: hypothetical protein VGD11_00320, partial [Mycobacteriales bacterium]
EDHHGTYNVAGSGIVLLSQAIRRAGRLQLPVPRLAGVPLGMVVRRAGLVDFSAEQLEFLTYGRVLDTGRLARDFHFTTRYSTVQAFDDFVRSRNLSSVLAPDTIAAAERAILATVSRRRTDG